MQHSVFLWWVTIFVLAMTGSVIGMFCAVTARYYDSLMRTGCSPDGVSLINAMRAALAVPITPIIWVDHAGRSDFLSGTACSVSAVFLLALYARHGGQPQFLPFWFAGVILVMLACIDARVCLLPDALTQPLLWSGLVCAWAGIGPGLPDSVAGIVAGYALLAVPRLLWRWWRGQDGMGAGDVKLLAALGAWIGAPGIVDVLLVACIAGVVFAAIHQRRWRPSGAYPFGPFIVLGGLNEFLGHSGVHSWF